MRKPPPIVCLETNAYDGVPVPVTKGALPCRPTPCTECPWQKHIKIRILDSIGKDSTVENLRHAAQTAAPPYPLAICHMKRAVCAGWLLQCGDRNGGIRAAKERGDFDMIRSRYPLHTTFRAMAVANGLSPDDPALNRCLP